MRPYLVRYRPPPPSLPSVLSPRFSLPARYSSSPVLRSPSLRSARPTSTFAPGSGLTPVGADATTPSDSICRNKIIPPTVTPVPWKSPARGYEKRLPQSPGNIFRKIAIDCVSRARARFEKSSGRKRRRSSFIYCSKHGDEKKISILS